MPYSIQKRGEEHCIVKSDDPDGKSYGCHDSREKAQTQMAAIMANEKAYHEKAGRVLNYRNAKRAVDAHQMLGDMIMEAKLNEMTEEEKQFISRMGMLFRQPEVEYVTVSPSMGSEQCANCRFFCAADWQGGQLVGSSCHIVESYPDAILPTGYCKRWEIKPPHMEHPMPVVIVEEGEYAEMMYATPKQISPIQRGVRWLQGKQQPGFEITKGTDGLRYARLVTSNGYEDREHEHVATKALQEYVESCYAKDGTYIGDNRLLFWHRKDLVIGDIALAELVDGFLIEIAKERDTPIAKTYWDLWESTPDLDWAMSHGFYALKQDGNVYSRIRKVESSILLHNFAANLLTLSEVLTNGR